MFLFYFIFFIWGPQVVFHSESQFSRASSQYELTWAQNNKELNIAFRKANLNTDTAVYLKHSSPQKRN